MKSTGASAPWSTRGFDTKEAESFKKLMKTQCADLLQHGHKKFEWIMTEIQYFGEELSIVVESPEEEWDMRLSCAIRSCAINSGKIKMLHWEILLFEKDGLPDYPKFLKVPKLLLQQCVSPRLAAADFLADEDYQLSRMIKVMLGKKSMCLKLDRSFICDMVFLEKGPRACFKASCIARCSRACRAWRSR